MDCRPSTTSALATMTVDRPREPAGDRRRKLAGMGHGVGNALY
jgi:hypothetical protein